MKFLMKIILVLLIFGMIIQAKDIATVTGLNGQAFVKRDGTKIELNRGDKLQVKDIVITDAKAKVQIIFEDETIVTVGKNSTFSVAEYIFEENKEVVARFGMLKGAMRTITGNIGKISPDKFSVVTRTATIGIRGTNFSVIVKEDASHLVYCTFGAISVDFKDHEYIVKQGYYLSISTAGVVEIREFTPKDLKEMKAKYFGKSVPKVGLANNESLRDNIKKYYGDKVIQDVDLFVMDAKHTHKNIYNGPTPYSVIAGYSMSNADYDGSYTVDSTNGTGLIDGGFASLHVDFGADTYSLRLFNSVDNTGNVEINYDTLVSGANTTSFVLEKLGTSTFPYGNADGTFYGDSGNLVKGAYYYNDGNTQYANGTYTVTTQQVLH